MQADYKQISKFNNNSKEISSCSSVDRNLNNINCSGNNKSDLESAQKTIDYGQINAFNASNKIQSNSTNQHVDLAQMEYNVKQFLLKQNEWSPKEPSLSSVSASHSYC